MINRAMGNRVVMQDFYRDNGKCCMTRAHRYGIIVPVDVK